MSLPPHAPPHESTHPPDPDGLWARLRAASARLRGGELTAERLAFSVALGLFVGCSPLYGLHTLLVGGLAWALRLDVLSAYLASNISLPPFIPFLVYAEVQVGSLILNGHTVALHLSDLAPEQAIEHIVTLSVGAGMVGSLIALLGGGLVWVLGRRVELRRASRAPDSIQ